MPEHDDTPRGETRIPHALLEAIYTAPITALEMSVLLFVIRRTYGWQRKRLAEGEAVLDRMTAADIARGIQGSVRSVEGALHHLVSEGILLRGTTDNVRRGVPCWYGVNPDPEEWGNSPVWSRWYAGMREARQGGVTTRDNVVSLRRIAYRHYANARSDTTLIHVVCEPTNPTGSGAEVAPKDSIRHRTTYGKDRRPYGKGKGIARATAARCPSEPAEGSAETAAGEAVAGEPKQGSETPQQRIIREAWEAHGLEGLPEPEKRNEYGELVGLVQAKGEPFIRAWVEAVTAEGVTLPEGATPWKWFRDRFRGACKRPWEWQRRNGAAQRGPVDNADFGAISETGGRE